MFSFLSALWPKSAPPPAPPPFRPNLAIDYFRMPEAPAPARPVAPIVPGEYFDGSTQRYRRVHPTELLNVHVDLVEQIYQATGMERLEFRRRVYPILEFAAAAYQLVPASANNHHREPGGLLLHSMQACRHAVHLGQFARFESDRTRSVSPDDHKAWSIGLILAALTHDAGKLLTDFRVVHPSFFAPGRLLPKLDNGAPAEDERALFVPYDDTLFEWLERYGYHDYMVHWLANRYGNHDPYAHALINTWTNRMRSIVLPEKVRRTLDTAAPRAGTVEADFWEIIKKADRRSATQYFPAVPGNPGAIISDTLRRLVRDGTWRPSPTRYPLRIADNQRLLLRDPVDLGELANHITQHPLSYVLAAEGPVRVDVLATHLQFECLIEINPTWEARFAAAAVAAGSVPADQRVLMLNDTLSRELLDLALTAPPLPSPLASPTAPAGVDLRHLADAVPASPAMTGNPQVASQPAVGPVASAPAHETRGGDVPPLVTEFLDYLRALNPGALLAADRAGQSRPPKGVQLDELSVEPGEDGRIVIGRKVVQRFRHGRRESLDTVFSTLIACTSVVAHVDPPPPRTTLRLTFSGRVSASLLGRAVATRARPTAPPAPPASAPQAASPTGLSLPPPRPSFPQAQPEFRAIPLLYRLFAHPPLYEYLTHQLGNLPINVRFETLAAVLATAQREDPATAAGLDAAGLAQLFVDGGLPIEIEPGGICLKPAIADYWLRYRNEVFA